MTVKKSKNLSHMHVNLMVKTRMFVNGRLVNASYPVRSLSYTEENRDQLFAERDKLLSKGEDAFVIGTLSPLKPFEPSPDNRKERRSQQRFFSRLMRRLSKRMPKISEEDQKKVDVEVEKKMADKLVRLDASKT